jgi:trigger factor
MSLEMLGMDDEGFKKTYREMAIQQVQGELLLDAIAKQEDIQVEEAEIDAKMQEFADQSETPLEQVQKYFDNEQAKSSLKAQVLQEKVNTFLQEKAVITEVEKPVEESGATADEAADSAAKEA